MKHELIKDYKKPVILSALNLSENNFNDNWIRGVFSKELTSLYIIDQNDNRKEHKIYIGFNEFEIENNKKKNTDYSLIDQRIKTHINSEWEGISKNMQPLYDSFIRYVSPKDKKVLKVIFIYLSPKETTKVFDLSSIANKDKLICNIITMMLNTHYLEKLNEKSPLHIDVCAGKPFLSPQVSKSKNDKATANVFSYKLNYGDYKLDFNVKNEYYLLEKPQDQINLYHDICLKNKFKYARKLDARKYGRLFIDFKSYEKLEMTKFITQLRIYKNILATLDKFGIKYEKTSFNPQFLYSQFLVFDKSVKEINLYIQENEKKLLEEEMSGIGVQNALAELINYIENTLKIKVTLILSPTLELLLLNKNTPNLYLMSGKDYEDDYMSLRQEDGKVESWGNSMAAFIEKELFKKNYEEFLSFIKSFDTYSQVKMYNIYANLHSMEKIVSQGLIIDKEFIFKNPTQPEKTYPSKGVASKLSKCFNELKIKHDLFVRKEFVFDVRFAETKNDIDIQSVKVIQRIRKGKTNFYTCLELIRSSEDGDKAVFKTICNKLLIDEQINELNLAIDVKDELSQSNNLIIINDKFLLNIKDNNFMPFMILEESRFEVPNKDPDLLVKDYIKRGDASTVTKTSKPESGLFFPYNLPAVSTLINKKFDKVSPMANCLLDFKKENEVEVFMSFGQPINITVEKNNRLESISLHLLNEFGKEKLNWENHEQLLFFYLSTLTFDLLNINELSKKSILTKLADITLVN